MYLCKLCLEPIIWRSRSPLNPNGTDHKLTCKEQGAKKGITARRFGKCKFCQSAIKWLDKTPINIDGTKHAARCAGRPSGLIKNVMEQMIKDARQASSDSLANGIQNFL